MEFSARSSRGEEKLKERLRVVRTINISFLAALSVLGLIMLCISIWMIGVNFWHCPILNVVYVSPWLLLSLGVLSIVLSVVGVVLHFHGRQHGTFLPFMVATGVLTSGLLVVLIMSAKVGADLTTPEYATSLFDLFVEAKTEYFEREEVERPLLCWEAFQRHLRCCGGYAPTDWLQGVNRSADAAPNATTNTPQAVVPRSCDCPPDRQANSSCAQALVRHGVVRSLFRRGCILPIINLAQEHLTVLKVLTPCMLLFIVSHLSVLLCMTLRATRMSAVDVYSLGDAHSNDSFSGSRQGSGRRGHRFADVSGVAPFALQLETTVGCT